MSSNSDTTAMVLTEDKVLLRFWYDSAENAAVSAQEGRAIFDTVLMVDLVAPAQNASTPQIELERIWSPESLAFYKLPEGASRKSNNYEKYAKFIKDFKDSHVEMELGGTPLKEWPRITKGLTATLASQGVYTVEQVAAIADVSLDVLGMGGRELRNQAIQFLEQAQGQSDTSKLVAQISDLQAQVARLQADLVLANQNASDPSKLAPKAATLPDLMAPPVPEPLTL